MATLIKLVGTLVLVLILAFGGIHLFEYFNYGGIRGGVSSNLLIVGFALIVATVVIFGIVQIWKKK